MNNKINESFKIYGLKHKLPHGKVKIFKKYAFQFSHYIWSKNAIKKMNILIEKKNKKDALTYLPKLNSEIMKIAKTGIIKKRNASRNLSRITKKINSL